MTNQNDLMRISNNLTSMQDNFLNRITNSGFFSAFNWLEENQVKELDDIIFLRKYLREVMRRYRKKCSIEGYATYWEPFQMGRKHLIRKLVMTDKELKEIIKNKRGAL